ncbi:hypothetical protein [Streptomyces sp. NPDC093795]|uniref:hypothetical protein n=1 Tax=Streptomyces sp. NPDC093795 TaxID=3366051 RepID=UPI003810BAF8
MARLLELDAAGALTTAHVRAGAQVGGVNVRTVCRWLEAARTEGRMERRSRARLELSDQAWEVLAQAGGNVAALHRYLKEAGGEVPALASLHRVVRRELQAGRILPDRVVVRREQEEQQTRQALADLALACLREGGAAKTSAPRPPHPAPEAVAAASVGEDGALAGVALPAGAQLMRTSSVRAVAEAVGQAMATQGPMCVFGDPGRGKTAAVRMALHAQRPMPISRTAPSDSGILPTGTSGGGTTTPRDMSGLTCEGAGELGQAASSRSRSMAASRFFSR